MKIVICGDICPIGRNQSAFCSEQNRLGVAASVLTGYDIVLANLECPLIERPTPAVKGGPVLGAPVSAGVQLASLGVNAVTLGNNHILDHGPTGLLTTLRTLDEARISYVGAGPTLQAAGEPLLFDRGGSRVAVLAFAEREYSCATRDKPGACPLDMNLVVRKLSVLPKDHFSIVLVHGGNEHFPLPSPWLQDSCRLMIELGAKAVVCQHSHCIGACEEYREGLIVYGQGNLIFDLPSRYPSWWEGVLVSLSVDGTRLTDYELNPIVQEPGTDLVRHANSSESSRIVEAVKRYSTIVADQHSLEQEWQQFCWAKRRDYQSLLFGYGRVGLIANRMTGFADFKSRAGKMNIGNALRCASHLEVLRTLYSQESTTGEVAHDG
ncbi:MAG: hypothetical protein GXX96_11170 [Planctomycetaceae bacterium]|nr:hypothetical protein [Planctomycetaceae bacterium]